MMGMRYGQYQVGVRSILIIHTEIMQNHVDLPITATMLWDPRMVVFDTMIPAIT